MLYKKLNLPTNLPLANDKEIEINEVENNIINKLQSVSKINIDATIRLFEDFFENSLSPETREKLSKIFKEIVPIIFKNKHKEEGLYQLLRYINSINSNLDYIEIIKNNTFIYANLSKILLFSGLLTDILSKDIKLLEVIQPEYAVRLNGNISFYKNFFEKIDFENLDTESLLNITRKQHRLLKFQILYSLINNDINIERASSEFSYLAQATVEFVLQIIKTKMNNSKKANYEDFCIVAYGRFGTFTMTANSDLDLVFVYDGEHNKKAYLDLFRQLINILSTKTSEGILYEVDTKLRPSRNRGPVACTYENFENYHTHKSFSWEKLALKKTRVITDGKFSDKISNLLDKLNAYPISEREVVKEVIKMRVNINENKEDTQNLEKKILPKWFETKYVAGGQRDIEFLKFFYENNSNLIDQHEKDKKLLLFKRIDNLFFKLDQIVNICFTEKKQNNLPNAAISLLISETKEKDFGTLKAKINQSKIDIFNILNSILESEKSSFLQ